MSAIIPKVTKLSERVIRVLGCNPGPFTLQGTNTYLVGTGDNRVLIDTGERNNQEYINTLKDVLSSSQIKLSNIIITHWHPDHVGGLLSVLDLPNVHPGCKVFKFKNDKKDVINDQISYEYLRDEQSIEVDDKTTLRVLFTPGHTDDHAALLLDEEKSVFAGDCVLGEGSVIFEDLSDYLKSLEIIASFNPVKIYPGHGPEVYNPKEKINDLIGRRMNRERQIMECIRSSDSQGTTISEIVSIIFKDKPKELHPVAAFTITHHLQKLLKEQKVETDGLADQAHYWIKGVRNQCLKGL